LGSYKSFENSNGMACFIGILEEFYQEAEPHGNWKGSFVSLIEFLCFFCAPSKRSILQFPKDLFGRMNFVTYEQVKIHVFQTGPKYFQSIGFKMLGYYIPIYVFPIPAFLESCVSKRF